MLWSLLALLRAITSNHNGDFFCLNCFHAYKTENKFKKHDRVCNGDDYCYVQMSNNNNKISKCSHEKKSMKAPFTIYVDLECLLEKMSTCQKNPEKSYTEQKSN